MKLLAFTIAVYVSGMVLGYNPGIIVSIHEKEFGNLVSGILPAVNHLTKDFVEEETMSEGPLTIRRCQGSLNDLTSDQFQFDFTTEPGVIRFTLQNVGHTLKCDGDISIAFAHSSGSVHSSGIIEHISMRMIFRDFDETHKDKPYFSLKVTEMNFNKDSFQITADFQNIPDVIINKVIDLFKSQILDKVKDAILSKFDQQGDSIIDGIINAKYPAFVPIENLDISVCINLLSKPVLDSESLYLYLDGTVFSNSKGYNRTADAEVISIHTDDQFYLDLHITQYSVNTLFSALYDLEIDYLFNGFKLFFDSMDNESNIIIEENRIKVLNYSSKLGVELNSNYAKLSSGMEVVSNLIVKKEDDRIWATFDFSDFKFLNFDIDSSFYFPEGAANLISSLIEKVINYEQQFKVKVPKAVFPFNITVKDVGLQLFDKHMRVGLSIERQI
jgi:hypothetical protein